MPILLSPISFEHKLSPPERNIISIQVEDDVNQSGRELIGELDDVELTRLE